MAAHNDDEGADYWPGYVDALTAMVKLLAFVMMLLAVMVFTLSQKISQEAVLAIARAAKIDIPPNANMEEVAQQIARKLNDNDLVDKNLQLAPKQKNNAAEERATKPDAPPPPAILEKPQENPKESKSPDLPKTIQPSTSTAKSEDLAARSVDTDLRPTRSSQADISGGVLTLRFSERSAMMDAETMAQIKTYVLAQPQNTSFEIRANADGSSGTLSDMRRVSYYRAMQIRQLLIDNGLGKDRVVIRMSDVVNEAEGRTIRIISR